MAKVSVIIVAGGSGTRMGAELPKQFMDLDNQPILMRTIASFAQALPLAKIIVALPKVHFELWESLCHKHNFKIEHKLCEGSTTRFGSVKNALSHVGSCDLVAIHDGVRPMVSKELIDSTIVLAADSGSAVPVVLPVSSLRRVDKNGNSHVVDRATFREVQTPQVFSRELILRAYEQPFSDIFTDDASVVEALGHKVNLCQGDYLNIKITNPVDMVIAQAIITQK